jgi:hypothetical protein
MPWTECGPHRPYRSRAEAAAKASWHLTCWKCKAVGPINVFLCTRTGAHWHIGHRKPIAAVSS